jgi:hypothetical protein
MQVAPDNRCLLSFIHLCYCFLLLSNAPLYAQKSIEDKIDKIISKAMTEEGSPGWLARKLLSINGSIIQSFRHDKRSKDNGTGIHRCPE